MNRREFLKNLTIAGVTVPLGGLLSCSQDKDTITLPDLSTLSFNYQGEDGKSVLELLKRVDPKVNFYEESQGVLVTKIMGLSSGRDGNYWEFLTNGKFVENAHAGNFITQKSDIIEWRYFVHQPQAMVEDTSLVQAAPAGMSEVGVMQEACSWLGVPYVLGGESRSGIDCSGLVRCVYRNATGKFAYYTDRTAEDIRYASYQVYPPRPGDVVIFVAKTGADKGKCTHVGIYIAPGPGSGCPGSYSDSYFVHALHTIGDKEVKKVVEDRLYYSAYGTGVYYKYFNIYFARYNPDYWIG